MLLGCGLFVGGPAEAAATPPGPCGSLLLAGSTWLAGGGVDVLSNGGDEGTGTPCGGNAPSVNGQPTGLEWQCAELVNRLYLTRGWITSHWSGNGGDSQQGVNDSLYDEAPAGLSKQPNGSITSVGPGDVVSINEYKTVKGVTSFLEDGHALIVNSGGVVTSGSVPLVSQNSGSSTNATVKKSATLSAGTLTLASSGTYSYVVIGVVHAPPATPPAFTAASPPGGTVGAPYAYTFTASGSPTLTFAVAGKTLLPAGLTLSASGVLSGTPTAASTTKFKVKVSNSAGSATSAQLSVKIVAGTAPSWALQTTPNVVLYPNLQAVSCASGTNCEAVGGGASFGGSPNAQHWDGASWTAQTIASPDSVGLGGVSCPTATFCEAVGDGSGGAVAENWNGSIWTLQSIPGLTGYLTAVSCASVSSCVAVGEGGSGASGTISASWNGTAWTGLDIATPSAGADLNGISCVSSTFCQAVGDAYNSHGTPFAFAERWDGSAWALETVTGPAGAQYSVLSGVSCPSATVCEAVGYYENAANAYPPMAQVWNGSVWAGQTAPTNMGEHAVSCTSATSCESVGVLSTAAPTTSLWNGSNWAVQATPVPSGSTSARLLGVSCPTASVCEAVGYTNTSSLAMRYS